MIVPCLVEESLIELSEFEVGTVIDNRFQIVSRLGEGGMAVVYEAFQRELNRTVALKMLKSSRVETGKLSRFRREVQAISALSHPNIVSVYCIGISGVVPYIAMEFLQGKSMSDVIASQGPLAWKDALPLFVQVCDALGHAHEKGIIHSDLKPSNLVVAGEGKQAKVTLVDFGVAKILNAGQEPTTTSSVAGSFIYMSPEQCHGRALNATSDIYALGCTLYETLVGKPPFQRASIAETVLAHQQERPLAPSKFVPGIPSTLDLVIAHCLEKEGANRYQTAAALRADLENVLDGKALQYVPSDLGKREARRAEPRFTRLLVVLSAMAVVAVSMYHHFESQPQAEADELVCRVQSARLLSQVYYLIVHNDLPRAEQTLSEADAYAAPLRDHYFDGLRRWCRAAIEIRKAKLQKPTAYQTELWRQAATNSEEAYKNLEEARRLAVKTRNLYQRQLIETCELTNFRDQYVLAQDTHTPKQLIVLAGRLMAFAAAASKFGGPDKSFFDTVFKEGLSECIKEKDKHAAVQLVGTRVSACRAQGYSQQEIDSEVELAAQKVEALLADGQMAAEIRRFKSH